MPEPALQANARRAVASFRWLAATRAHIRPRLADGHLALVAAEALQHTPTSARARLNRLRRRSQSALGSHPAYAWQWAVTGRPSRSSANWRRSVIQPPLAHFRTIRDGLPATQIGPLVRRQAHCERWPQSSNSVAFCTPTTLLRIRNHWNLLLVNILSVSPAPGPGGAPCYLGVTDGGLGRLTR